MNLFIFGYGYTGQYIAESAMALGVNIFGTSRDPLKRKQGVEKKIKLFDFGSAEMVEHLMKSDAVISCIPPQEQDPVLLKFFPPYIKFTLAP